MQTKLTRKIIARTKTEDLPALALLYGKKPEWVYYVKRAREIKQFKKRGY